MIRAALYARYSSDQQNAASIADQLRICREHATREGWQMVGSFEDAAISGASMILRPGVQKLLADAQAGSFTSCSPKRSTGCRVIKPMLRPSTSTSSSRVHRYCDTLEAAI